MSKRNDAVLDFLLTRRSQPAKLLKTPAPSAEELNTILTAAARTPDHGKLEPWRFVVLGKEALSRIAKEMPERGAALGVDPDKVAKSAATYGNAQLAVVVLSTPKAGAGIPEIEQVYSAGAVCLALVNAAHAMGYGANWLSGWASHDDACARAFFDKQDGEAVAGVIHLGSFDNLAPERPRPDLAKITKWISE